MSQSTGLGLPLRETVFIGSIDDLTVEYYLMDRLDIANIFQRIFVENNQVGFFADFHRAVFIGYPQPFGRIYCGALQYFPGRYAVFARNIKN